MNSILLADVMVSTTFIVFAYIAIAAAALVIFVGLFDPGLRYKISVSAADDNRSQSFLHTLEALADSKVQQRMKLTVLTNGTEFYEEELRTIEAATRSVNLEAYIFKPGAIAQRYIDALTGRARAGRVEGEVVPNLQATFAENWLEGCGEVLTGPDYFPTPDECASGGAALVVNSMPSAGGSTRARMLFQLLLASAKKTIHITTPYFLPDRSMIDELLRAVRDRGVEVRLLVPGKRSDLLLTRSSSRHGYGKLLKAGAAIFEYQPAMIHAKILLIDSVWGVVGSTNFDNRSFGLNDEVNLAVRYTPFVERLESDFARDIAVSERISYEQWCRRPVLERAPELLGWVLERQQ